MSASGWEGVSPQNLKFIVFFYLAKHISFNHKILLQVGIICVNQYPVSHAILFKRIKVILIYVWRGRKLMRRMMLSFYHESFQRFFHGVKVLIYFRQYLVLRQQFPLALLLQHFGDLSQILNHFGLFLTFLLQHSHCFPEIRILSLNIGNLKMYLFLLLQLLTAHHSPPLKTDQDCFLSFYFSIKDPQREMSIHNFHPFMVLMIISNIIQTFFEVTIELLENLLSSIQTS